MRDDNLPQDKPSMTETFYFIERTIKEIHEQPDISAKISANSDYIFTDEYFDMIHKRVKPHLLKYHMRREQYEAALGSTLMFMFVNKLAAKTLGEDNSLNKELNFPAGAKILLYFSAPQEAIGDLEELYHNVAQKRGYKEAKIWLWCQVAKSVVPFAFAAILRIIRLSHLLEWIFKPL